MNTNPIRTNISITMKKNHTDKTYNLYLINLAQDSIHLFVMNTEMNVRIL